MILHDDFLELYALMCRAISKPVRLKLLHRIGKGKINVGELQKHLGISMSSLSNHLNELYRSGILGREKDGNFVYYYLTNPDLLDGISNMQKIIMQINAKRSSANYS